jgi:hypothetical protein
MASCLGSGGSLLLGTGLFFRGSRLIQWRNKSLIDKPRSLAFARNFTRSSSLRKVENGIARSRTHGFLFGFF